MSSPIIKIPLELKANYLRDPENFLRDIACVPTESTRPFFKDKNKVYEVEKRLLKIPLTMKKGDWREILFPHLEQMILVVICILIWV